MTERLRELVAAFMLLTRLPVARLSGKATAAQAAWAFPVVGAAIGLMGGLVMRFAAARLPPLLAAGWTLAALLLLTGALHEDGLADTADGLGGGATLDRKLEIMRDSRIGSFGALALGTSLLVRAAALAALPSERFVPCALAAETVARAGMLVAMIRMAPARLEGLGAAMQRAPRGSLLAGLLIAELICWAALPAEQAVIVTFGTGAVALGLSVFIHRQVGGYTGDTLGAIEQVCACAAFSVLSAYH